MQIKWKIFQGFSRTKKRKKHMKRLSFITQFKIEFFLPFTSCRKVLGKIPDMCTNNYLRCTKHEVHNHVCKHVIRCTKKHAPRFLILEALPHTWVRKYYLIQWLYSEKLCSYWIINKAKTTNCKTKQNRRDIFLVQTSLQQVN